jgi:hypothetical protein
MSGSPATTALRERQLRIIGRVASIDDPDLLARLELLIDRHNSGLEPLDDAEIQDILADLRRGRGA